MRQRLDFRRGYEDRIVRILSEPQLLVKLLGIK
jgi:hypothetical protein